MDIIVCIKRVPDTAELSVVIDESGKKLKEEKLTFDINEPDSYALEEAILMKEKTGGTVTLVSIGNEETDSVLRMGLAKGADKAVRIWDDCIDGSDAHGIAFILAKAIEKNNYNLVLTGCMAQDDGYTQVGPAIAELIGIPHAAIVTKVEVKENMLHVHRELEGGLTEAIEVQIPALLTIQTGINVPRYASMIGIRKAAKKPIEVLTLADLDIKGEEVGENGSKVYIDKIYIPPVTKKAEILEGSPEEVSAKLVNVLKGKGVV